MKAMIFAAGLGTRLRPLTDNMPKALVPVDGRPLVDYAIEKLRDSGFDDIVVNVHHFASMLREHLEGRDYGVKIEISDESDLLRDTGGGILHAQPLLEGSGHFLVHNVDILSNLCVPELISNVRTDALATLVVSERETSRYLLFDEDMRMVGWTNVSTGEVRSPFSGLDVSKCRRLAFAGIHYISDEIFMEMVGMPEKFSIIDFYLKICGEKPVYGYVPADFKMLDVGKPAALSAAGEFIRRIPRAL